MESTALKNTEPLDSSGEENRLGQTEQEDNTSVQENLEINQDSHNLNVNQEDISTERRQSVLVYYENNDEIISPELDLCDTQIRPAVATVQPGIHCNPRCFTQNTTRNEAPVDLQQMRIRRRQFRWRIRRINQEISANPAQLDLFIPNTQATGASTRLMNRQLDYGLTIPNERNAPPTYNAVMSNSCPYDIHCNSFISPLPPPTYAQAEGETNEDNPSGNVLEFRVTTHWDHGRQPAYCYVCQTMVITRVKHRVSRFTHMSALVLCFSGCWPLCLLPYCFNLFKTTYHYCPTCGTCVGVHPVFVNE